MNDGVLPRSKIEGKNNSSEDKSNYKVILTGDMVYNSMRMWQGANGISPCDGIVSPAYTVLMSKISISNGYFAALFKSPNLINEFRKNSQGMTSDTWNLKYPQIKTIKICIPTLSEQEQIADMLSILEKKIATQTLLIDSLKKYKRGLSNYIFQEIIKTSKIIKFRDIFELSPNNTLSRDCLNYDSGKYKNIHYGDILVKFDEIVYGSNPLIPFVNSNIKIDKYESLKLNTGDIIIADTAEDKTVGKCIEIVIDNNELVLSGLHTIVCRPKKTFINGYLGYYMNSTIFHNQLLPLIQGTKVSSINRKQIADTSIYYPSEQTQRNIVNILTELNCKIECQENTVHLLTEYKNGLLQQLFI